MNEFELIETYFQKTALSRPEVITGIGDDCACVQVPENEQLLITCDTLVSGVHFLESWDAYDIAWRSVMVNVSDIAAMGGQPCWISLALTMPYVDAHWLKQFSAGFQAACKEYNIALIGGDTTKGPLTINITLYGLIAKGKAVYRRGATPGDVIFVTGELGGAALAVNELSSSTLNKTSLARVMSKLLRPRPRVDFAPILTTFASAAIDLSDGLSSDLTHICTQSQVKAQLNLHELPMHACLHKIDSSLALKLALSGGDDYELCFTVAKHKVSDMKRVCRELGLAVFEIGQIEKGQGIIGVLNHKSISINAEGYRHF